MPIATTIRIVDTDREAAFPDLLDKLQAALERRFEGHAVQLARNAAPAPIPVIVHDVGDGTVEQAMREELDQIDPDWRMWLAVER